MIIINFKVAINYCRLYLYHLLNLRNRIHMNTNNLEDFIGFVPLLKIFNRFSNLWFLNPFFNVGIRTFISEYTNT